jgi:poly(A) polymerase
VKLDPDKHAWMKAPETHAVLAALGAGNARFVGGAVRNALIGREVVEVDIATSLTPGEVAERLEAAGLAAIPTGIAHGTITAVSNSRPFEITTLRRDVETDGRHATVAFTRSWEEDARRRDFTMNALFASESGEVFDYVGGIDDLMAGRVRFVGDPATRIREDYLRILRLFRFHALYGRGELDGDALRAATSEKQGLASLSGERVQKEMLRLLLAQDPLPALRTMAAVSVLTEVLPGTLAMRRLERSVAIDSDCFFDADAIRRLAALLPDEAAAARVSGLWKLSNSDAERLSDICGAREKIVSYLSVKEVHKFLYRLGKERFRDRVFLKWAEDSKESNAVQWRALLALADSWRRPRLPVTGRDVIAAGVPEGPLVGRVLSEVEEWWIDSDFTEDEFSLAERLKAVVQAIAY